MLEKDIEKRLCFEVRKMGGICEKFVSPGNPGVPDRIIIMPGGWVWFVELKTETGRLSTIQKYQRERYVALGVRHRVVVGLAGVKALLDEIRTVCAVNKEVMPDEVHTS